MFVTKACSANSWSCRERVLAFILDQNDYFSFVNADKYTHITDQELLAKFQADRNNEWLGILLQRYTLLLLGVCMKYLKNEDDAKDSVQPIFLKVIQELQKYKLRDGMITTHLSVFARLYFAQRFPLSGPQR